MSGSNDTVNSIKGLSSLEKAKFGPGMLLRHDDLEQLNLYTRGLSRMLFRSFFGCGVVCGLVVRVSDNCGKISITVGMGLGIDCAGDPIYVPKDTSLPIDEKCDPDLKGPLWVLLCPSKSCCAPRTSSCGCDEDEKHSECTRERAGYEIRVVRIVPKCACGCPMPRPDEGKPGYTPAGTKVANDGKTTMEDPCSCADPNDPCYAKHYAGVCGCACEGDSDCSCGCDCVVLAQLDNTLEATPWWTVDHRVRRFIRPVLMRDPQAWIEEQERKKKKADADAQRAQAVQAKAALRPHRPNKPVVQAPPVIT